MTRTAISSDEAKYPEVVTSEMVKEAARIAQVITGIFDWNGITQCSGQPGLVCMVQEYIDTCWEVRDCGFIAIELAGMYWVGYRN
jgi:hypothetical protein